MQNLYKFHYKKAARKIVEGSVGIKNKSKPQLDLGLILTSSETMCCLLFITFGLCIRISVIMRACREEQWQCEDSSFLKSLSSLAVGSGQPQNLRYFFSIISLVVIVLIMRYWLKFCGNLNGTSAAVIIASYTPTLSAVSIALYWALQALPEKIQDSLPTWQIVMLPQLVYLMVLISIVVLVIQPLSIFVLQRDVKSNLSQTIMPGEESSQVIHKLCKHLKNSWRDTTELKPPLVYGLATVFSASQIILLIAVALLLCLLLGDGLVFAVLFQLVSLFCYLELHAISIKNSK